MNLNEHYKGVRARLNAGKPEPVLEPEPVFNLGPLMAEAHALADTPIGPMWKAIIREVAAKHNLSIDELIGPRRWKHLVTARLEAYHRLREHGYSMPQIANRMGGRDHTTVLAGLRAYRERFDPMRRAGDL